MCRPKVPAWRRLQRHLWVAGVLLCGGPASAADTQPLVFGVFPYLPAAQLEKLYAPVAADLSDATGREVQLRTRPSFELFREELEEQHYDLVFIQPVAYVLVARRQGYRSIARPMHDLQAIFVVRSDSKLRDFGDLRNSTLAMPPRQAAVSVLARQTLREQNLAVGTDVRITYQNNHAACLRAVLIRKAAACVTAPPPLKIFAERTGMQFRTLGHSRAIPGSTYAIHQRVPAAVRSAITDRIISWNRRETGRALLDSLEFSDFIPSDDEDYRPLRDMLDTLNASPEPGNEGGSSLVAH